MYIYIHMYIHVKYIYIWIHRYTQITYLSWVWIGTSIYLRACSLAHSVHRSPGFGLIPGWCASLLTPPSRAAVARVKALEKCQGTAACEAWEIPNTRCRAVWFFGKIPKELGVFFWGVLRIVIVPSKISPSFFFPRILFQSCLRNPSWSDRGHPPTPWLRRRYRRHHHEVVAACWR